MSADNWEVCPRCFKRAKREYEAEVERVSGLYGKVQVEMFDEARTALKEPDAEDFRTFREDYEFYGADEGEVHASYKGSCSKCDLSAELSESRRFYFEDAEELAR